MLEGAKNYLVSVAERTVGIHGFNLERDGFRDRIAARSYNLDEFSSRREKQQSIASGVILGSIQFALPTVASGILYFIGHDINKRISLPPENTISLIEVGKFYSGFALDMGLLALAASDHNFAEIVVLKLAANAATHVGLDIVGAVASRMKSFKPTSVTLAA